MKVSPNDRAKRPENDGGGNLSEGLSSQQPISKSYAPRDSGQGERPSPPKREKKGKFTIR